MRPPDLAAIPQITESQWSSYNPDTVIPPTQTQRRPLEPQQPPVKVKSHQEVLDDLLKIHDMDQTKPSFESAKQPTTVYRSFE